MPDIKLNDLQKQRLDKLAKIKSLNINPYPQPNLSDKSTVADARESLDKSVLVAGRLMSLRGHGKILFADLHDQTGKIQLFFQEKILGEKMDLTKLLDLGDIISVCGDVFQTQAGEITINVFKFEILAKNMRPLPEKWHGLQDIEERYRQRYVDLIVNPEVREVFKTRSKILTEMRHFLDDHGFLEVETPILQPVYGGASAKPFTTHHNVLDMDMYLRISDELYIKRLIVGGFEKVYEVSRDFRNEGVSRFHNPEFTQIEFYWAYVDYEVLMNFTEELVKHVIKTVKGDLKITFQETELDFSKPIERVTFTDVIEKHTGINIDKIENEEEFKKVIKDKNLKVDMSGVVGIGACFDALYKEHVRPKIINPTFVCDYPSEMIALAKRKADNPKKISSFQLLVCGTELLKAYNELNDPKDQADRWLEEGELAKKGSEIASQFDYDYIRALEYGMPPTSGWGMGIDRFTQFITDQSTIKDVILFPAMRNEENTLPQMDFSEPAGLENKKIVIGKIISIKNHPNADNLKIYDTKISEDKIISIISSCRNIKEGDVVPVALVGALVYTPDDSTMKIRITKMRGIESPAMMCSPLELGVEKKHDGIFLLPDDLDKYIGEPVNKYYYKK
jgi:lysyl-tRNA synthetase class 2